ncbi:methyltransferase domain-containing protein [Mesorhizobium sp. M8A.F.Ca.ET.208.01.1.1]|uniref:class I SAM-dependent methyltransferase n=1 Tax=unclassified Mesorhizobium TaxID=325217 RepID=UPI001093F731|nr:MULTISPECIES: methyltransferase domain-containing protein [unclassified Mesorhizobium]TGQ94112.1 methyltransferase domain-containing protein [Mesorhizobium sp. M8A.F.Ca.ET.208.01.1.1]TGT54602.1 methyltransferase domain-containing protein [Mesorhizobium sp. M8A.F.Ca.ET.167.01.1.1]
MATVEPGIARHYEISGLEERILAALAGAGVDVAHLRAGDLEAVDEFHIGGVAATRDLIGQLGLKPGARLLDIGSGIGGPARFVANNAGVDVTGIDLTQSYVDIATSLSRRTGMAGKTHFVQGSALDMPFAKAGFDAAMILHVGMNLPDKAKLMSEAARVLKPGGVFAVYDVMRLKDDDLTYPLPWASNETISFVATPDDYRSAAAAAGFSVTAERQRGAFAIEFFAAMRARLAAAQAEGRKPSPGLGLVMGEDARTKMANLIAALEGGILAPVELLLRLG